MSTKVAALALAVMALATAGCANGSGLKQDDSDQARKSAYQAASDRGFTPTAYTEGVLGSNPEVSVTFGACFGRLQMGDKVITLLFQHAVAGAGPNGASEVSRFDNPSVSVLKDNSAYRPCFS